MARYVTKQFALSSPLRTQLLEIVGQEPGINMCQLAERLSCRPSTIIWHKTKLEKADLLRSERVGNERVFYLPAGGIALRNQSLTSALLKNDVARRIHEIVSQQPGITLKAIAARLMERASSLRWHIKRLVEEGLLCLGQGTGRSTELYPGMHVGSPCQRHSG